MGLRKGSSEGAVEQRLVGALAVAASLALASLPVAAHAKTILVIGTHPDDELLMAAGRTRTGVAAGDVVKTVVVTNGDINGVTSGLQREAYSVAGAQTLGLTEQDVIFLGYGDGLLRTIYDSASGTQIYTSNAGQTATYGNRGLGGMEYHRYLTGVHGPYNRNTMMADFRSLFTNFRPDEIYTHSIFESHDDHRSTALAVIEALVSLKRSGIDLPTKLYQSVVWMPGVGSTTSAPWPQIDSSGWTPLVPFLQWTSPCVPGQCLDQTQFEWSRLRRFSQPAEMQITTQSTNLKAVALNQGASWYNSFVRRDEFFWLLDLGVDLAVTAQVSASSENSAGGQGAAKAVDGAIAGAPAEPVKEWVTLNQLSGAWIQLNWPSPVRIAQVNLYDRPDANENVVSGTLTFSDSTSIAVGALPANGRVLPVTFAPKTVSWVRFTVNQAVGTATGLSEFQVLGALATSTANIPPHVIQGPVAASDSIPASQSTTLSVVAHDLDGDPLQYQWSADGGFIQGNGSSATFTPPAVSTATYFTITVQVLDGRGGTASNSTFVQVTPAPTDSVSVSPSAVFGGDGAQGTVVLGTAAPTGGKIIPLSSSNPAAAAVPASVTVAAGATTATFPVVTSSVSASTPVTISAAFAGGTRNAVLTVAPRSVSAVSVSPTSIVGGGTAQGTVTLPLPAGAQGAAVQLSSSDPAHAGVPASVTVPAGASSASFSITTVPVATSTPVTVSATYGTTASAVLMVGPLAVSALSLNPASVVGGSASTATVALNGAAPAGGALVALTSSAPATAAVPASVTVPAGASSVSFAVTTSAVAASTTVTIAASFGGATASALLTVGPNVPPPPNPNLLSSPEQIGAAPWQILGAITATLNYATAPDGSLHATRAVSSGAGHALRQAVVLTPGTTYTLSFYARNNGGTAASYSVFDSDHFANIVGPTSYASQLNGSTYTRVSVTFTVPAGCSNVFVYPLRDSGGPVDVLLWGAKLEIGSIATAYQGLSSDSVSLSPATVPGGGSVQGALTVATAAPSGGTTVALSSSNPSVASVPASVTVPAGATSATFAVTTGAVSATTSVTITAAFASGARTATLTVTPLLVSSLAVSPASVVGGAASQGTVTLSTAAPAPGVAVGLSASDGTLASVPSSVTVAAGATSATFAIGTSAVTAAANVTISAGYGSSSASAVLGLNPLVVSSIALNPTSLLGGSSSVATVTLNGAAGGSGALVLLATSHPTLAPVPSTVTVPSGATSATFTVNTQPVGVQVVATISASYGGVTQAATLTVSPPDLSSLSLSPASVLGGQATTGTVTLTGPAPGGNAVTLASSDPAATVPGMVSVPTGATSTTFTVDTAAVAAPVADVISASLGTTTRTSTLTIAPLRISALALNPTSVAGGGGSTGTVTLNGPAPAAGAAVTLASSDPAATVPASVTVAAGSTSATFTMSTSAVTVTTTATISAAYGGATQTAALAVTAPLAVSTLAMTPATVTGGGSATGTITLNGPAPAAGAAVTLASSDPAATVPASATVAAGATSATFTVNTAAVAVATTAIVSASYGASSQTAALGVTPPPVASLALSPATVAGGASAAATVTLAAAAPVGGLPVALSSNSPSAIVPASVTVPAGGTSAAFTVATLAVASPASATISATVGSSTQTALLTVVPLAASALSLDPATLVGGSSSLATVTLNGPASAGGAVVALTSSAPATAAVPASATVPAGASSVTFTVTTTAVAVSTTVTIAASLGGANASASLTVGPNAPPPNPNLLSNPEQVGGTSWDRFGDLSATLNYALAPDGTQHASRLVSTGGGHALRQMISLTAGQSYTLSFFARNNGGSRASYSVFDFDHFQNIVAPTSYVALIGGSAWTRVSVTFTVPAGCSNVGVYPLRDSGGPVDMLIWGAKLEVGATMTAY